MTPKGSKSVFVWRLPSVSLHDFCFAVQQVDSDNQFLPVPGLANKRHGNAVGLDLHEEAIVDRKPAVLNLLD